MAAVRTKRVYDQAEPGDGYRVLVDRLWPRGVKKTDLEHDEWIRDIAPSADLRRWFGHDPERFETFARRYRKELEGDEQAERLARIAAERPITLLYAAKDREHNHAIVLADYLSKRKSPA